MKQNTSLVKRAGSVGSTLILGLCLSTSIVTNVLAKPGNGGGKPGGGDDPPPPANAPFLYDITWLDPANADDVLKPYDVAPDGTVVGNLYPGGDQPSRHAFVRFPGGSDINLEALLHQTGDLPADWRATTTFRICDNGLIGIDVLDPTGRVYCGALTLSAGGSVVSFSLLSDSDGGGALLADASEDGEFLVIVGEVTTIGPSGPATNVVWDPAMGTVIPLPGSAAEVADSAISNVRAALRGTEIDDYVSGTTSVLTPPAPYAPEDFNPSDLGADGTVTAVLYGSGKGKNRTPTIAVRLLPGSSVWEELFPDPQFNRLWVNKTGEICGATPDGNVLYHDDYGLLTVNNLINPNQDPTALSRWNSEGSFLHLVFSDPLPGDPYGGVILGTNFILIPVAAP